MEKLKPYLIHLSVIGLCALLFYFLGEFLLPFFLALFAAYLIQPHIVRLQKWIPNRNLAVTVYLLSGILLGVAFVVLFGVQIVRDFERLNDAFVSYADTHKEEIDATEAEIKSYLEMIYDDEDVQATLESAMSDSSSESLTDAFSNIMSFLGGSSEGEDGTVQEPKEDRSINWFLVFLSSIGYFVYIIYTFPYFERRFGHYFGEGPDAGGEVGRFITDFRRIYLDYFRRRSTVVLICTVIFLTTFLILDLPGAILLALLAGLLCFIAHFHYLVLLPLALSSWVATVEQDQHFLLFYGIVVAVFIGISILEELWLYPTFMEPIDGINPAIFALASAIWIHYLGGIVGGFLALPLTSAALIYADRVLTYWKEERERGREITSQN